MRDERQSFRVEIPGEQALSAELELFGSRRRVRCRVTSVSRAGVGAILDNGAREFLAGQRIVLHVTLPIAPGQNAFHALVRHARANDDELYLGLQFVRTADPTADGCRDGLVREYVMHFQRRTFTRRSGVAARRAR